MTEKQKFEALTAVVGKSSPNVEKGRCGSLRLEVNVTWMSWSHILGHLVNLVGLPATDTRQVVSV
jgi:hypothetical protein